MKHLTVILSIIFLSCLKAEGHTDTLVVNGIKFIVIEQTVENEFNTIDTLIKLYRIRNGQREYLLKHYLYTYGADCNNEFTNKGSFKVQHDSLVFITEYFQKTGLDPIPLERKQVFKVSLTGKVTEVYDKQLERSGEWVDCEFSDE